MDKETHNPHHLFATTKTCHIIKEELRVPVLPIPVFGRRGMKSQYTMILIL